MNYVIKRALVDSIGTAAYMVLVASFMFSLRNFPRLENIIFIPIAMLMLFVCSAAITGFLVFGKPVMLYIDGKKKEAISLLGYTLWIMVILTILLFVFLIVYFA